MQLDGLPEPAVADDAGPAIDQPGSGSQVVLLQNTVAKSVAVPEIRGCPEDDLGILYQRLGKAVVVVDTGTSDIHDQCQRPRCGNLCRRRGRRR